MASTSEGPSIAQLINRFRTERPVKRPGRDSARKKQFDDLVWWSSGEETPVTRDMQKTAITSFPPAAHASQPQASPRKAILHKTQVPMVTAADAQKPAQKPSRVGALLELAESCPPLKEALRSITLSPAAMRDEQSMSAVEQALHASERIINQIPRIAARGYGTAYEDRWKIQPCESPEALSSQKRPSSPTQRFQNLAVHLSGTDRVPGRLHSATRSMTSSPESHAELKIPSHHASDAHKAAASQPPQRNDDDQPYHALARDYSTSTSAGSFWSPGSSRSPSPAVCIRTAQSPISHTTRLSSLVPAADQAHPSETPPAPALVSTLTASVSVTQPITVRSTTLKHGIKDNFSPRQELVSDDATDRSECGSCVSLKEVPQRTLEAGVAELQTGLRDFSTQHTPGPEWLDRNTDAQPVPMAVSKQVGVDPLRADEGQTQDESHSVASACHSVSVQARDVRGRPAVSGNGVCESPAMSTNSMHGSISVVSSVDALCGDCTPVVSSPSPVRQERIAASSPAACNTAHSAGAQAGMDSPSGELNLAAKGIAAGYVSNGDTADAVLQHCEPKTISAAGDTAQFSRAAVLPTGHVPNKESGNNSFDNTGALTKRGLHALPEHQSEPETQNESPQGILSGTPIAQQALSSSSGSPVLEEEQPGISEQNSTRPCIGNTLAARKGEQTESSFAETAACTFEHTVDEQAMCKEQHSNQPTRNDDDDDINQESGNIDAHSPQKANSHAEAVVLRSLSDNRQRTPHAPSKRIPKNTSEDSSPELPTSPKGRRRQLLHNAKVEDLQSGRTLHTAHPEQAGENELHMESAMRPHNASTTVDEVRSIYWQLDSFMEQYMATQCPSLHLAAGRGEGSNFTTLMNEREINSAKDVEQGVQDQGLRGVAPLDSTSCVLHLSVKSKPICPNKQLGDTDSLVQPHDSQLGTQGLQAVLQLSTRSAEISIFDGDKGNSHSAVIMDNLGENFARGQQVPSCHQEAASQVTGGRHPRAICESDDSSETESDNSSENPRLRVIKQQDAKLREGNPKVKTAASQKLVLAPQCRTPYSDRNEVLSVPFAAPMHIPTHAPWLEPITCEARHRTSTSHKAPSSAGSLL